MKAKTIKRLAGVALAIAMLVTCVLSVSAADGEANETGEAGCGASIVSFGILSGWGPSCPLMIGEYNCFYGTRYEVFDCANKCHGNPNGFSGYILRCNSHGIIDQNGKIMGIC